MKLIDLLEKDKENLLTELAAAKKADKAVRVLENELDRLLLMYNEQCDSEREQNAAAHMLQAVRLSLPLLDSVGETEVWEIEAAGATGAAGAAGKRKGRLGPLVILFMVAAVVLCAVGLVPLLDALDDAGKDVEMLRLIGFELGGLAAAVIAGTLLRAPTPKPAKRSQRVEVRTDPDKVYRSFRNAILVVDQNLEEIRSTERWEQREEGGTIDGREVSSSELDLFSDLLAAAYSKDPDYAMEKIDDIRYYLHKQQIEVVDYDGGNAQFFDMMPGQLAGTIRPALVENGNLLRKGMASAGAR